MQYQEYNRKLGYNTSICLKSAAPTPTIRIERGRSDALTKASLVSWRSVTTPSCKSDEGHKITKKIRKKRRWKGKLISLVLYRYNKQDKILAAIVGERTRSNFCSCVDHLTE